MRAEVERRLEHLAFDRLRLFLPIVIFAICLAMVLSEPAGVPLPGSAIVINCAMVVLAVSLYLGLRAQRLPPRLAHAIGALVWAIAPINTLSSYAITGEATLVMPLMIEIASIALVLDTAWALMISIPVVIVGVPLSLNAGGQPIYPVSLVGLWVVAMLMQVWIRRWTIRAETHRLDLERGAEELAKELAERHRAEDESARLRDQFVHAQRMDAVGTLAAGLAHDMNNILGGILAFAEVLHSEATSEQVKADLTRIRTEAERGAALTRSLLAFSRRGQYRKKPILLHAILDDVVPLLSRTLGKQITVVRRDGPATTIDGDSAQLGQVLLNLCLNARDAIVEAGTVTIATDEVTLAVGDVATLPAGRYARLSVTDTGTGIDAETQKRIFEPFFTTKPIGKGTGLGLAMVFGAVHAHGGAVAVDSVVGTGTTMHVYLPVSGANPALPASDPEPHRNAAGLVLVVDDEPVVRTATARLVQKIGLSTLTACDGVEALELYKQRSADIVLVLLDMVMPKLGGADCYRALRQLGTTPVLLVSGYAADAVAQELLDAGAAGFLEKPYTKAELEAAIDRVLGPTRAGSSAL